MRAGTGWSDRSIRWRHKDGSIRHLESNSLPILDTAGELIGFRGADRDVTDRVAAEMAVRNSERSLAKAQQIAHIGNWEIDLTTDLSRGSAEAFSIFGIPPEDVERLTVEYVRLCVHPDDRDVVRWEFLKAAATGRVEPIEFRIVRKSDGEIRSVRTESEFLRDDGGALVKIIGTVQDVTERTVAEDQRRKHQRELAHFSRLSTMGEMVAGIAHEINQPLFAISNYSDACSVALENSDVESCQRVLQWAHEISSQANRAGQIIRRLGKFVKKNESRLAPLELNQLVSDSVELLVFESHHMNVVVDVEVAAGSPTVRGDEIQLQQVIVNLLRNAHDALMDNPRDDRRVVVRTVVAEDRAKIEIQDNGHGVSVDAAKRLFDTFYTTKKNGMGMGLAISRSIAEAHAGELHCYSNDSGGMTFVLVLPLIEMEVAGAD